MPARLGLVVGKFAPPHRGHDLLIQTAHEHCEEIVLLVYSNPDFPLMPSGVRARWLETRHPRARVFVPESPPPNDADDLTHREFVRAWLEERGLRPEVVFTSEVYGPGFAEHLGLPHVSVDLERAQIPVSGTAVRAQLERLRQTCIPTNTPEGCWDWPSVEGLPIVPDLLPKVLRWLEPVHRVVFMGAESTGKSTLTRRMAQEYATLHIPEYGREVWEAEAGALEPDDYTHIARRHLEVEDAAMRELAALERHPERPRYLFSDTSALTTLHFAFYYNRTAPPELWDIARRSERRYHHVFVCDDDLPFEQDGTRDSELTRSRVQGLILYDLQRRGIPYQVVSGPLEARVEQVRRSLEGTG